MAGNLPLINVRKMLCGLGQKAESPEETAFKQTLGVFEGAIAATPFSTLEVGVKKKIKVPKLAFCNLVSTVVLLCLFMFWTVYHAKSYLGREHVQGKARYQIQHPVGKGCNPLNEGCTADFDKPKEIDYCRKKENLDKNSTQLECEYLDEFDLLTSNFPAADDFTGTFMLPTHIERFAQKMMCARDVPYCPKRYVMTDHSETFVADIERFTLLLDHSFLIADNTKEYNHKNIVGFVLFCPPVQLYGIHEALRELSHPSCARMVLPSHGDHPPRYDELVEFWDDSYKWPEYFRKKIKELDPMFSIKPGIVFRVGPLIELLGLDMDGNDHHLRKNGFVLLVDVNYRNVRKDTLPNDLPPIYEMSFRVMNKSEFKTMSTESTGPDTRTIIDSHGIYFVTNQVGDIRAFSLSKTLVALFGLGIILGVCRWLVLCLFLNTSHVDEAENLEDHIRPPLLLTKGLEEADQHLGSESEESASDCTSKLGQWSSRRRLGLAPP